MVMWTLSSGTQILLEIGNKNLAVFLIMVTIIVHLLILKKVRERTIKFANYETLKKALGYEILRSNLLPLILRILSFTCFILALSHFSLSIIKPVNDVDFVIALDVSQSMLQSDNGNFTPSRLEVAKKDGIEILKVLPETTMVGLVSFSGKARIEHELSTNHDEVAASLRDLTTKPPAGTVIGDALVTSAMMLSNSTKKKRAIVLITDGKQSEGLGVSVDEAVNYLKNANIVVNAIGIGRRNETVISLEDINVTDLPEEIRKKLEKNKSYVLPKELDEEMLIYITNSTGGKYFYVSNESEVAQAYDESILKYNAIRVDARKYALYAGIVFVFLEWLLGVTKYKTIP